MPPTARRLIPWIAAVLILAALAAAAYRFLGNGPTRRPDTPAASAKRTEVATKIRYRCPMHPAWVSDRPGDCPICDMRMAPIESEKEDAGSPSGTPVDASPREASTRRRVIYRSTMNPNEVRNEPGKDSMGMEMVPVEIDDEAPGTPEVEGHAAIRIPVRKQQLIGVRTDIVRRAPLVRTIRAVGRVTADETRLRHIHTKFAGWVETLEVNAIGERVRLGQPLLRIYSPEILATQEEHLIALRARNRLAEGPLSEAQRRADELVESSRRRLLLYDLTVEQIERLERSGEPSRTVALHSPVSGYVLQRNVTQGEKIDIGMNLLDIADLSRVWVIASVYQYELPFVRPGQPAAMTLAYLPGKRYEGRVALVYPALEGATRTAQVRLEFANPDLALKPEMYAEVQLHGDLGVRLVVPESAVLSTGTRDLLFVAKEDGYFEPREVRLGVRLPDAVEILAGVAEGERVVTSGNFLIDSESKMKAALKATAPPLPGEAPR
jgi:RND family efflux transporter MFP subunit